MTEPLYGIFGGTFDPIHNGHLETVQSVQQQCALDIVHFIPSAVPPHKASTHASPQHRLEMVALAIAPYPCFDLDDRELCRKSVSYSYDTVRSMQNENPGRKYCFIVGVDVLLSLETWYRWQALFEHVHFIVMQRPGWDAPTPLPLWWQQRQVNSVDDLRRNSAGKILNIAVKPTPISATQNRNAVSNAINVSDMMPIPVWDYICKNNLYRLT